MLKRFVLLLFAVTVILLLGGPALLNAGVGHDDLLYRIMQVVGLLMFTGGLYVLLLDIIVLVLAVGSVVVQWILAGSDG